MSHFHKAYSVCCGNASTCMYVAQFTDAIAITYANNRGIFDPGAGPIFLDNVDCRGNETSLANCSHRGIGVHNCRHYQDAGVNCSQGMLMLCMYGCVCMVSTNSTYRYTH